MKTQLNSVINDQGLQNDIINMIGGAYNYSVHVILLKLLITQYKWVVTDLCTVTAGQNGVMLQDRECRCRIYIVLQLFCPPGVLVSAGPEAKIIICSFRSTSPPPTQRLFYSSVWLFLIEA